MFFFNRFFARPRVPCVGDSVEITSDVLSCKGRLGRLVEIMDSGCHVVEFATPVPWSNETRIYRIGVDLSELRIL